MNIKPQLFLTMVAALAVLNIGTPGQEQGSSQQPRVDKSPQMTSRLLTEFVAANCETTLMQTDHLMMNLLNESFSKGMVIVFGKHSDYKYITSIIRNWLITYREAPQERLEFRQGGSRGPKPFVEIWLVPNGAELPAVSPPPTAEESKESKPVFIKAGIFSEAYEYPDGVAGCELPLDVEGFAELLRNNPKFRGNIVVVGPDRKYNRKREKELMAKLLDAGVQRSRIRAFVLKKRVAGVELWIRPA